MVDLSSLSQDPTLVAVDAAIESAHFGGDNNGIAMSEIARECERQIWADHRWISYRRADAAAIKRFEDGYAGEDLMAKRLRMVTGVTLVTVDPETGGQYKLKELGGHFSGKIDGAILGLLQAPKTWHVWEHKQVEQKSLNKLAKLKRELGEKSALEHWNINYFGQAQCYMQYTGMDRHYLTCALPGGRDYIGVRTNRQVDVGMRLEAKARRVMVSTRPPARISDNPAFFGCRWCHHKDWCHGGGMPRTNCRTCLHSNPVGNGLWHCDRWGIDIDYQKQQAGCQAHLFISDLIAGDQIDAGDGWVSYRRPDGSIWIDGSQPDPGKLLIGQMVDLNSCCPSCGVLTFEVAVEPGVDAFYRCTGCRASIGPVPAELLVQ